MAHPRLDKSSLRGKYGIHLQAGLALSLGLLLTAARLSLPLGQTAKPDRPGAEKQETIALRPVQPTEPREERAPPAPPRPPVPQVVPGGKAIGPTGVAFDASLSLTASGEGVSSMPAAPSSSVEGRPDCGGPASLRKKTYYPPTALRKGLEGRVSVRFVIGKEGEVRRPRIADGSNEVLNRAALRAIQRLECTPGKQRSRPVRVKMTMPVVFALPRRMEPHRMEPHRMEPRRLGSGSIEPGRPGRREDQSRY